MTRGGHARQRAPRHGRRGYGVSGWDEPRRAHSHSCVRTTERSCRSQEINESAALRARRLDGGAHGLGDVVKHPGAGMSATEARSTTNAVSASPPRRKGIDRKGTRPGTTTCTERDLTWHPERFPQHLQEPRTERPSHLKWIHRRLACTETGQDQTARRAGRSDQLQGRSESRGETGTGPPPAAVSGH